MLIRRAARNTIPVIVLAGYLGAGKTTILNHILRAAVGARIAVVVNDFGSVNIDTLLITAQTDQKLELSNGCICCSLDGGEFDEVLDMAIASKPDVVIIEASGLAEPEDLARKILLSPNREVGYGGLVYAVDAVNYRETLKRHRRVAEHIELADLVVLTKVEQVSAESARAAEAKLAKKTKAPIVPVHRGELSAQLLFDTPQRELVQPSLLQGAEAGHFHDEYMSVSFETAEALDPEKFRAFMNHPPRGIYRIKGFLYFGVAGYEQKFVLQSVGGRWDMYAEEWGEGEGPRTAIVLIGRTFSKSEVLQTLRGTVGESSQVVDIQRYTST